MLRGRRKEEYKNERILIYGGLGFNPAGRAWHVARMGKRRAAYRVLVGKPEGRRPVERTRHRREDNIKMDL